MMDRKAYTKRRYELVADVERLLFIHCRLCAMAKIRKIADLDYEVKGIDKEETKRSFRYYNLK